MRTLKIFLICAIVFICNAVEAGHLEEIAERGTIRIGTTGDYRPMSYFNEKTGEYEGIDAELSKIIADSLGVEIEYVPTTWKTLTADTLAGKFDIALCGISRNYARAKTMAMSDGYGVGYFGKTILCRKKDAKKFRTLADIDKPSVRVMINPGGTNEIFAKTNLKRAQLIVYNENAEIPNQISIGNADIMITETVEALRYIALDKNLAAPLIDKPFTTHSCGILMQKGDQEFLNYINFVLAEIRDDGTLAKLEQKYLR
ncbi:MAG: transporter substrate-binding domain-containing protein [Selenomonadaceae bacterium]|nr:transporter substrate-binding domain-containing protein [Selenomonadaceae bacterium]